MNRRDEQARLTATWLNTIGAGSVVAGIVPPLVSVLEHGAAPGWKLIAGSIVWILVGLCLHFAGRRMLDRSRE